MLDMGMENSPVLIDKDDTGKILHGISNCMDNSFLKKTIYSIKKSMTFFCNIYTFSWGTVQYFNACIQHK